MLGETGRGESFRGKRGSEGGKSMLGSAKFQNKGQDETTW